MDKQTKTAIIAISIIIPLSSFAVWWNFSQSVTLPASSVEHKIIAIASFYPLYEFTKQVGKEKVEVSVLVPFGIEPHDWEPTVKDLQRMQEADLIVINGAGFENWLNNFASLNSEATIVDTSNGISIIKETDAHDEHGIPSDPHIWLNPVIAQKQVENIAQALMEIDPSNKDYYHKNADSYILKLEDLDDKIKKELSQCQKKDFIAFHSAFTYFANQYGLIQHSIVEFDPHGEPTSKNLENLIKLAKTLDINIIFTEEAVDTRTSEVIANEINGKVSILSPLEIGDENTDYIEKMDQNLLNLEEALCK